jgi:glycerate kinase
MRVLIAPDKFAGTLTAVQAASAIAEGWRRRAPGDELDLAPMADGGPGFVEVLHDALGGRLLDTESSRPPVSTSRTSWRTCRTSCGRR